LVPEEEAAAPGIIIVTRLLLLVVLFLARLLAIIMESRLLADMIVSKNLSFKFTVLLADVGSSTDERALSGLI
jgi:hypothetical protein